MSTLASQAAPPATTPEPPALEALFAQCQNELLGTLFYLVGNREDALDALQESFLKCWRHRGEIAQIDNLRAWIFRIVLNTGRDLRQTAWRRKRQGLPDAELAAPRTPDPQQVAEESEQMGRLRQAIHELREEEQTVFLLRQNGDLTYEEIALALEIPTGTVKTRMRLALEKLRNVLNGR